MHGSNVVICLYSYLYLKLAKMPYLSYYHLCLLFNKIGEDGKQVLTGSHGGRRVDGGGGAGERDGQNNV
jgi:hypothetical protein